MKPKPDESCLLKSTDDTVNVVLDGRVAGQSHADAVWRKAFLDTRIEDYQLSQKYKKYTILLFIELIVTITNKFLVHINN